MAQTQRKPVYILPQHHNTLHCIAYERRCNLSDVLDSVLEMTDWEQITQKASTKPVLRLKERSDVYQVSRKPPEAPS
ncbi:hypothetical protein GlitD10_1041 [Gloeomargarita lithophora Alchichica-D10]|uniref:Uncharacterized protein n=1 Tax=Gloeomargarita lithophora Alchichica-D10 TaxID=1188229 RepID=A0A1J0ABT7_9CYAN|nr:hypothetical protein GlitD10_1041 [Gloeomargarita lithophora Alchichica-D10]